MAVLTRFARFDVHQAGQTAAQKFADLIDAKIPDSKFKRKAGQAGTGTNVLTDPARDFAADGITTSERVRIFNGAGNIEREEAITAVGTTTIDVAGAAFDTTDNIQYRVYTPPTDAEIRDDPKKRGDGTIGLEEFMGKIDDLIDTNSTQSENLAGNTISAGFTENLTQLVIVFDDGAYIIIAAFTDELRKLAKKKKNIPLMRRETKDDLGKKKYAPGSHFSVEKDPADIARPYERDGANAQHMSIEAENSENGKLYDTNHNL